MPLVKLSRSAAEVLSAQAQWPSSCNHSPLFCLSRRHQFEWVAKLLADQGYEPQVTGSEKTLRNCPFHSLAEEHHQLVCQMNFELIDALLESGALSGAGARPEPTPGRCCVSVRW